jgi:mono/diheme cytochrome c family protein
LDIDTDMHLNQLHVVSKNALKLSRFLVIIPMVTFLASCGQVDLSKKDASMTLPTVTRGPEIPQDPTDTPSSADGSVWYKQQNCAQCHGEKGEGGTAKISFADTTYMDQQKPTEQYMFVRYGFNANHPLGTPKEVKDHPKLDATLTTRKIWDTVFYCRSLSRPIISTSSPEYLALDQTFGSNCAVCHGKKGTADGPLAHNLEPVPANFANFARFYDRTDAILWDHIANGIKWEGMPNFKGKTDKAKNVKFDDAYIWKLVQYVRHFQSSDVATAVVAQGNSSEAKSSATTPATK